MIFHTVIIGFIGIIIFNLKQKIYQYKNNHISEITKNLLPLDLCIKKRQSLDQIKINKFKLKYIPLDNEEYLNQYRLSKHILSNLFDKSKLTVNMKTKNYEITKHFILLNDDVTIFYGYVIGRYLFREVGKKIFSVQDTLEIEYADQKEYSELTQFRFYYLTKDTKLIDQHYFKINNFKYIDNTIVIDVSNDI